MGIVILLMSSLAILLHKFHLYVVIKQSVAIIERFGRYQKTSSSGMNSVFL